ncbi:hypothetical protein ACFPTY_09905 [Halomonas beimenensis]|uniref:hypothetical protein n=1 Tax=Halomonas beimenensis TaxID=475662 RepID=UPI0012903E7E|nr:hypothetical protein [Halomonas beimenensis]
MIYHIYRSEGFGVQTRIEVQTGSKSIIARLNVIESDAGLLPSGFIGLSKIAWERLKLSQGQQVATSHPAWVNSQTQVRRKIFAPSESQFQAIIRDILNEEHP